ncbi:MAG: hypothetical protein ACI9KE_000426 [Polyangiales bacterium]|jgi:hypothetical protein
MQSRPIFVSLMMCLLSTMGCGDETAGPADSSVDVQFVMDAAAVDANAMDANAVDAGGPDVGTSRVPLFLAIGWGGRHIASCDMGRTWINDTSESAEDDWHQTYTPKSLAYQDGLFVRMTGWGTASTVHASRDGLEWTSVELSGRGGTAVGFDEQWTVLTDNNIYVSDDGLDWGVLDGAPFSALNRDGAVYPGLWVSGSDGTVQFNRGEGWVDLASCNGQRHTSIGVNGGFAASPDRVVSFGDGGETCVVDRNTGADLGAGSMGASVNGVGAYVNGEFWVGTGGRLYRSPDGLSWTDDAIASGARFELVADSGEGTIAAASRNGDAFYYSDDNGASWQEADAPMGNDLYRMVFGWAEPSAQCPAR